MKKNSFEYSALDEHEKQKIENIRKKHEEGKVNIGLTKLRKLHEKIKSVPIAFACTFGFLATVVLVLGLAMILQLNWLILGITASILGGLCCLITYPMYRIMYIKIKTQCSDEIIEISHSLIEESKQEN